MWTVEASVVSTLIPTLILLIGLVDDLWYRKFHNWLFLSLLILMICFLTFIEGLTGLITGFQSLGIAFALSLPLVALGVMGAGDMKLLMVFAMATNMSVTFNVIVMAFFWGGLLGLCYALVSGKLFSLLNNLKILLVYHIKPIKTSFNVIPYTVAIFMAWATQVLILTPYKVQLWS